MEDSAAPRIATRPLVGDDLQAIVAIDRAITGYSRHDYFRRRVRCAEREPAHHAQFVATDGRGLAGYVFARLMAGEFGRVEPALRIEAIGVRDDAHHQGIGDRLLGAMKDFARAHRIREFRTAAKWNDHGMLRWFDAAGFRLAPNHVVDCRVDAAEVHRVEKDDEQPAAVTAREIDYGAAAENDFERLARDRAEVRSMKPEDLPGVIRIDRRLTGRDRGDYVRSIFSEAMDDTVIRVSLVALDRDAVVGYLIARADLGDFGRSVPVAILDTIGVDPDYVHHGIGRALLSQLFLNLDALRIDRVETVVAPRDLALLGFLYDAGFAPSQRLPFILTLD
jgi:GNAT superfamily N-acetyltransferase